MTVAEVRQQKKATTANKALDTAVLVLVFCLFAGLAYFLSK